MVATGEATTGVAGCRWAFVGLVCLTWVSVAGAQSATGGTAEPNDDIERVEALSLQGVEAYKAGDYARALQLFQAALAIEPVANLLYNVARTYERLGQWEQALQFYERFVRQPTAPPDAVERARSRIALIRSQLAAARHAAAPAPTTPPPAASPPAVVHTTAPLPRAERSRGTEVAGWVTASTGLAALVAGGILYGLAASESSAFDNAVTFEGKQQHRDRAESYALAGDVSTGIGGAALAVGITLLVLEWTAPAPAAAARVDSDPVDGVPSVRLSAAPAGVVARWSF